MKLSTLVAVWFAVVALAVLGIAVLWANPTNFLALLLGWPLVLWAAIAPSGEEPR